MTTRSVEDKILQSSFAERGYYFPLRVLSNEEVAYFQQQYADFHERNRSQLQKLPANEQYPIWSETHTSLKWVYQMAAHPKVLDAVSTILGSNLMVWGTRWFTKMPGDKTYISWHQDATYWGLHPPDVTTAWIALSDSVSENGCMRVIPETHKAGLLPQNETYAPDNALSRGQEIAVAVEESQAVDIVLRPGEMSLHHIGIVHGSNANISGAPRIGLAIRYISTAVLQDAKERSLAMLVRGRDEFGHFDLIDPPSEDSPATAHAQSEAVRRMMANVMPRK
jgi:non-haem Fe2+, alpha-ketoglutarate-dependent halogenase